MGEFTDKIKGKINEIKGETTGDETTRQKGELQQQKGRLKGAFERGKARMKDVLNKKE